MQEVDDDDLLGILDEDDEMLTCTREAQILFQTRIDQPSAILRRCGSRRDVVADGNQVLFIGRSLSRSECRVRPFGDIDQ